MKHVRSPNLSLATGVAWLLAVVLATTNGYAQPARRPREETTQQRLAQAQPATLSPADCPDRQGSARAATEARELHRSRNLLAAEARWDVAVSLCGLPDRYEGRARTREARQGELDGEERLRLLDGSISDYTTAVQRSHFVQGFDASAIEAALPSLRTARETLDRRIHPLSITRVQPPVGPAAVCTANTQIDPANCGACGNRCGGDQACNAGRCTAIVGLRPVIVPPPSRSHALPITLMAAGGAITAVSIPLAVITGNDAETTCDEQGRTTGCNMVASGPHPRTVSTAAWAAAAVGGAVAIAGLVLELLPQRRETTPPRGATARLTGGVDRDGNPFLGLGGTF